MQLARRTQAQRNAATRQALVTAARELFSAVGFAATGYEEIAKAAGVTRGALHHKFADRSDLFAAVFEEVEAEIMGKIEAAVASLGDSDPVAKMREAAKAWLEVSTNRKLNRIVVLDAPAALGLHRWRVIADRYGMALVKRLLSEAVRTGQIPEQPIDPLGYVFLGALREGAVFVASARHKAKARREVGAVIDRLIVSLAGES